MQLTARPHGLHLGAAVLILAALAGCSKPADGNGAPSAAATTPGGGASSQASAPSGSACDLKLLAPSDISGAGLLTGTITVSPLEGDKQSCIFASGDYRVTVSLRPGVGDMTVQTVLSGGENVAATPLSGVGDKAAWTPELHEVNATRNNVLCDIQASGTPGATQAAVGGLCNKIYSGLAARPAG